MSTRGSINTLIEGLQHKDPRLYDVLKRITTDLNRLNLEVFPPEEAALIQDNADSPPPELATFTYTLLPDNILLEWTLSSGSAARYEIREGGSSFETANIVIQTDTSSARIDPLTEGTHRYWIKGLSEGGTYSNTALFIDIVISPIGGFSVTAQVIDNNVLLYWTQPVSVFRLSHYIVKKDGVQVGTHSGTFAALFENVADTYIYSVQAVDIVGNVSAESSVSASVTQPPDYELRANALSTLNGTSVNGTLISGPRLLQNTRVETYAEHFADRGWACIQDQLNAGFPLYIQPSVLTGSYEETIDYGLVISNTVISISYNTVLIAGLGVTVQVEIETSLDNVTYTAPVIATTLFVASLRYARITFTFTALN